MFGCLLRNHDVKAELTLIKFGILLELIYGKLQYSELRVLLVIGYPECRKLFNTYTRSSFV